MKRKVKMVQRQRGIKHPVIVKFTWRDVHPLLRPGVRQYIQKNNLDVHCIEVISPNEVVIHNTSDWERPSK